MKRLIVTLALAAGLLAACTPAATPTLAPLRHNPDFDYARRDVRAIAEPLDEPGLELDEAERALDSEGGEQHDL